MTSGDPLASNNNSVLKFNDFLNFTNSSNISQNKENVDIVNLKQGMQGACLNETCELTDEGDTTNQNKNRDQKMIKSLKTKSVLRNKPEIELEQRRVQTIQNEFLDTSDLNNTLSSFDSIDDIDESLLCRKKVTWLKSKWISDLYAQNAGNTEISEFELGKQTSLTYACDCNKSPEVNSKDYSSKYHEFYQYRFEKEVEYSQKAL